LTLASLLLFKIAVAVAIGTIVLIVGIFVGIAAIIHWQGTRDTHPLLYAGPPFRARGATSGNEARPVEATHNEDVERASNADNRIRMAIEVKSRTVSI